MFQFQSYCDSYCDFGICKWKQAEPKAEPGRVNASFALLLGCWEEILRAVLVLAKMIHKMSRFFCTACFCFACGQCWSSLGTTTIFKLMQIQRPYCVRIYCNRIWGIQISCPTLWGVEVPSLLGSEFEGLSDGEDKLLATIVLRMLVEVVVAVAAVAVGGDAVKSWNFVSLDFRNRKPRKS